MQKICVLLVLVLTTVLTNSYYITGCPGDLIQENIISSKPKLIQQVAHGSLYQYQDSGLYLVETEGTAKQMGHAIGQLRKKEIKENIQNFIQYVDSNIVELLVSYGVPNFLAVTFGEYGVYVFENLLSLNWFAASVFIPSRFKEELEGLAEGSEIDIQYLRNYNMVQETLQGAGASSFASAWGEQVEDEQFYTFKGLDWPASSPIYKNPLIVVYKSTEEGSVPFANITYDGIIGAISVVNSKGVSITEKVWVNTQQKVSWTYLGTPFSFVLRDLAQFGTTSESLVQGIYDAKRTARIYVGLGSGESNQFQIAQYSQKYVEIYNDRNYTDYTETFPQLDGIMFMNQFTQPNNIQCFSDIFYNYLELEPLGKVTLQTMAFGIPQLAQTGLSQIVTADVLNNIVYVAYSQGKDSPAYNQPMNKIDLNQFYN